ncbi:hypothetical protein J2T09_002969 [Neorhizobium huautlense]|uniref:Uncharacterized protein n=1 Tax=Neorhizobium huautlense TaxID=67774 RepID=A0ABT9PUQ4_9HYPH|nr:hypothetical protein [Neorhizobium huautlense]MDP9838202.1 hypothetical protein [Neorhizobium huautlense]
MSGDFQNFDVSLFGTWCDVGEDIALMDVARGVVLEVKSADVRQAEMQAAGDMRPILNEATCELKRQFETFRDLRASAEAMLADGDEAAQKLARADIKAAIDAMSLIVRTLEKIDTLQRQFARDRQAEAERVADAGGYQEAKARFMAMIEDRANEGAYELFEEWKRDGPPDWVEERLAGRCAQPKGVAASGGGGVQEDGAGVAAIPEADHHNQLPA